MPLSKVIHDKTLD